MTSIVTSRAQTPDLSPTKNNQTSRASTAFRTTDRGTKASWGNRFVKDFNDLTYDIKYDLIKGKSEMNHNRKFKKNSTYSGRVSSATIDTSQIRPGTSPSKQSNIAKFFQINKSVNPQRHVIIQEPKYSTLDSQGLCKHEYEKTIIGKMTHKSNHHMLFKHQTKRNDNVNHVWYDNARQLNFSKMMKTINRNKIDQCHDFGSYTDRRVFEPREELDKFYNTEKPERKTKSITIKQTVRINKITGRRDPKLPPGTKLQYNQEQAKKFTSTRAPSYEISKSKRELVFGRQVISSERGCYR